MTQRVVPPVVLALVVLGVLATGVFIVFQMVRGMPDAPVAETPPPPMTKPMGEPAEIRPRPDLPALEESDELVRGLATQLSEHPQFAAWLIPDRLIERFVTTVANVAEGESPRPHLGFLELEGGFAVDESGGGLHVDRSSFRRYDFVAEVFTSVDTAAGVRLYRELQPLFEKAYSDLGLPAEGFETALAQAIDHILETPIPTGELELERRATSYHLADPALENLSPAQKHFLRMGAANMREVYAKLRIMRTALHLPPA